MIIKKAIYLFAFTLCLSMLAMSLTACSSSEADKAYDNWANSSLPKMTQANTDLEKKISEVSGDKEATINAINDFLTTIKSVADELAAIDKTKLSKERKTGAETQLTDIQNQISTLEAQLATVQDSQ